MTETLITKDLQELPDGWHWVPIGDAFDFKNGLNKAKQYFGKGTPIVNYMDVFRHRGLTAGEIKGKVTVDSVELKNYEARIGDVFFTRTSETVDEIGISSVVTDEIEDTVFSGFILRARPRKEVLATAFCKYCFSSSIVREQIVSTSTYTTRALTNGTSLSRVLVPAPKDIDEQIAIAEALSSLERLISSLDELLDKKRNIKQGAMQLLLTGKKRLDGFSGKWEEKELGTIGDFYSGGTPSTSNSEYYGGDIPWITSSDLNKKRICTVDGRITEKGLQHSSAKLVKEKALLVAMYGATAGVVAVSEITAAINQAVLAVAVNGQNDVEFFFQKLTNLKDWIISTYTQGGQPNLSGNVIKQIKFEIPLFDEQKAISQVLGAIDLEIEAIEIAMNKYISIKHGMMQELLTGKTRLV